MEVTPGGQAAYVRDVVFLVALEAKDLVPADVHWTFFNASGAVVSQGWGITGWPRTSRLAWRCERPTVRQRIVPGLVLRSDSQCAGRHLEHAVGPAELRSNLAAKRVPSFLEEVRPRLLPGVAHDPAAALVWVEATFIPLLP